jgi:hypothetical protein
VCYNAHRIYGYGQVVENFAGLRVKQFALVTDQGALLIDADPELAERQKYGCGCFWLERPR